MSFILSSAQTISSLRAWPIALLTAESCWTILLTFASSSIICITPRICHSIRRSLSQTRFFCAISFIFIGKIVRNIIVFLFSKGKTRICTEGSIQKKSAIASEKREFYEKMVEDKRFTPSQLYQVMLFGVAEDKRFELLRRLLACTLSKGVHSATMRILQKAPGFYEKRGLLQIEEKNFTLSAFCLYFILYLTALGLCTALSKHFS